MSKTKKRSNKGVNKPLNKASHSLNPGINLWLFLNEIARFFFQFLHIFPSIAFFLKTIMVAAY